MQKSILAWLGHDFLDTAFTMANAIQKHARHDVGVTLSLPWITLNRSSVVSRPHPLYAVVFHLFAFILIRLLRRQHLELHLTCQTSQAYVWILALQADASMVSFWCLATWWLGTKRQQRKCVDLGLMLDTTFLPSTEIIVCFVCWRLSFSEHGISLLSWCYDRQCKSRLFETKFRSPSSYEKYGFAWPSIQ
jgi:hypothetical protein